MILGRRALRGEYFTVLGFLRGVRVVRVLVLAVGCWLLDRLYRQEAEGSKE